MKQKAFTLIELLVVVAIIGILAAVGVVAYNGYTTSAKKSEIETPTGLNYTTPGFDFVCYNSCKERNDESLCRKQCTLALE